MASTKDLAIASISAAVGAVAAAAALRFLSSYGAASPTKHQNPPTPCSEQLAVNGCAAERPPVQSPFDPAKREGYISWDDYFMAIAFLSAERSKDPNRQVGACLVSQEGIILGIGYNGFPRGCSDNKLPWAKKSARGDPLETKYPYVVHAEVNAILNTNHASAAGQKLYVTMFPCNECAKIIIQSGVSEVIYFVEKRIGNSDYVYVASHKLLSMAGVKETPTADVTNTNQVSGASKLAVHCQVAKSGFAPDIHVRNALLARYAVCDPDLAPAEQLFGEMPRPEVVAWTTMITSYRNRGRTFHALATFRRMLASPVAPNRVTMVAALGACAAHCAVDTGIWIHEYVQKQGWEMDVVLGTALVDMYGKCGKVSDGMYVFSEMANRNVYTWNSIIGALALAQDGKTALQWFSRMQDDGVQPDAVTLICVLCACAHAGFVDIGRKIFNLIIQGEYGFQPGIKHFGCMVDLLTRSGHLDDAFRVVETMPSQPNAVIWGLLLRGCKARGDSWLSEHVTTRLVELEPENASHYVLLSNLYAETGRWQEAQGILQWMKKKGLKKDAGWSLRMNDILTLVPL
ncbi:hypothetical protein E2562_002977 [Oryza meyeriana var. granulata]|uniref:dCMP deaminase n=1 Tax=Oryza meyeriana var. granulata TaxID=110450 RepID=A0A6G1DFM6_9ORYZ|nr:hypothetical protein E2562_002977 [Oryza meyeriana var. granulata]